MLLSDKLYAAHLAFGKLIVAFDFDDTVYPYTFGVDTSATMNLLKEVKQQGHTLVCYTCRHDNKLPKEFCSKHGFMFDYFNESPITVENGSSEAKIYYNVLLDDKAGLTEASNALREALRLISKKG